MSNVEALKIMQRTELKQLRIKHALDLADALKEKPTMVSPAIAELITKFDAATDKIAARIQTLINDGSFTPEDAAALQAEVNKLNALGEDPANPVPANV
jgi:cytochrome c556